MHLNVDQLMSRLADERTVFHSEADFQHAFAWVIRQEHPSAKLRLERRIDLPAEFGTRSAYIDIWVELAGTQSAIELKYQTIAFKHEEDGEHFDLRNRGAEDNLGYDFLKDLERVENFVQLGGPGSTGHVILLANEPLWNNGPKSKPYSKDAFRLNGGRVLSGTLAWGKDLPPTNPRQKPVCLRGRYELKWKSYRPDSPFRYLHLIASGHPS